MFTNGLFAGFEAKLLAEAAKIGVETLKLFGTDVETTVADAKKLVDVGTPIAVEEITKQAALVATGRQKFSAAVVAVWQRLEAAVGPVAEQDVHALVQNTWNGLTQIARGALKDLGL